MVIVKVLESSSLYSNFVCSRLGSSSLASSSLASSPEIWRSFDLGFALVADFACCGFFGESCVGGMKSKESLLEDESVLCSLEFGSGRSEAPGFRPGVRGTIGSESTDTDRGRLSRKVEVFIGEGLGPGS